ncbi:MAG: hypothetical protein PHE50_08970 [Dehalococcoidales bacterium]|nr:hypothetical protein [Dehalococcoidales bacterium]
MNNLTKAKKRIRNAGIAGCVLALLTVLQSLFPFLGFSPATFLGFMLNKPIWGLNAFYSFTILNFIIIVVLTIYVFKKNEIPSILLFACGLLALVATLPETIGLHGVPSLIMLIILGFLLFGMVGTFDYHQLKSKNTNPEIKMGLFTAPLYDCKQKNGWSWSE